MTAPGPSNSSSGRRSSGSGTGGASGGGDGGGQHQTDTSTSPSSGASPMTSAELSQALKDLARGDQAASQLEADLDKFEKKLDEMLALFGDDPPAGSTNAKENERDGGGKKKDGV